ACRVRCPWRRMTESTAGLRRRTRGLRAEQDFHGVAGEVPLDGTHAAYQLDDDIGIADASILVEIHDEVLVGICKFDKPDLDVFYLVFIRCEGRVQGREQRITGS